MKINPNLNVILGGFERNSRVNWIVIELREMVLTAKGYLTSPSKTDQSTILVPTESSRYFSV